MIARLVAFVDRLLFCQHAEMLLQREPDGSLSRVCTKCAFTVQLVAKHGRVVPLASRSRSDQSNVVPLTRKKA